jgi:hypothetical protein
VSSSPANPLWCSGERVGDAHGVLHRFVDPQRPSGQACRQGLVIDVFHYEEVDRVGGNAMVCVWREGTFASDVVKRTDVGMA